MFDLFKCSHPANMLRVEKEATVENIDEDFDRVIYHLVCDKCGEKITIKHSKVIGGTDAFFERGRKKAEIERKYVKNPVAPTTPERRTRDTSSSSWLDNFVPIVSEVERSHFPSHSHKADDSYHGNGGDFGGAGATGSWDSSSNDSGSSGGDSGGGGD